MNKLQYDMFLKKVPKPYTYTDYFKWHEHEYFHPAFLSLTCTSRYGQNVWKINGKEIEYSWVKENLIAPYQKSHKIIVHIVCDIGLPCSKLNNSNLIKDRNIIFKVSKRYIHIFNTKRISKHIHITKTILVIYIHKSFI